MNYTQIEAKKYIIEFETEEEIQNFIRYFNDNTTVSSSQVEKMGISRQLLRYHVNNGQVRTIPYGKQKRYLLEDIKKIKR